MTAIILDEKTETGKILMATAKAIRKTNKSIHVLSNDLIEDFLLGKIMEETATGNYVSEDEVVHGLPRTDEEIKLSVARGMEQFRQGKGISHSEFLKEQATWK